MSGDNEALRTYQYHRDRDEAREALRELLPLVKGAGPQCNNHACAACAATARASAVLEGAERTHALVPNERLNELADAAEDQARGTGSWGRKWRALADAARAAARGERPEWPS